MKNLIETAKQGQLIVEKYTKGKRTFHRCFTSTENKYYRISKKVYYELLLNGAIPLIGIINVD